MATVTMGLWGQLDKGIDMSNPKGRVAALTTGAAVLALAATFTVAPAAIGFGSFDDAAYAQGKSGDKGNKGGGKGNKGGNKGKAGKSDKQKVGKSSGAQTRLGKSLGKLFKKEKRVKVARTNPSHSKKATTETQTDIETVSLHPSQKGRWNAANANQAALDAHIRNGNFNGTIGALAQYQLAGKAASGAELTEAEQAALDNFVSIDEMTYDDADLAALLNGDGTDDLDGDGLNDTLPTYEVVGGTATCVSLCDASGYDPNTIDADANDALSDYMDAQDQAAQEQAYSDFYSASEQRILDESNKSTDGIEEALLDDIAGKLGFERPEPLSEDPILDEAGNEIPADDGDLLDDLVNASEADTQADAAGDAMLAFTEESAQN